MFHGATPTATFTPIPNQPSPTATNTPSNVAYCGDVNWVNLAYVAFTRGEMQTAVTRLTQFLRTHGRDAEALFLMGQAYEKLGRTAESQRVIEQATRLSPRLEKWVGQPIPNIARLRTQYNATELRMPFDTTIWNEARLSRKAAAQDASDVLGGRRN